MFDPREELDRMIAELRRPVRVDPAVDARVLQQIIPRRGRTRSLASAAARWLIAPRHVPLSPLAVLGIAAAVVVLTLVAPLRRDRTPSTGDAARPELRFMVVAPQASRVALVGDFNDWDPARTPMRPVGASGTTWTAILSLSPGRYRYGFLVDGARWMIDRAAPRAADDEFDAPSSVVTVGGL